MPSSTDYFNLNTGLFQKPFRKLIRIAFHAYHGTYSGIDQHFQTDTARHRCAVQRGTGYGDAVKCRLNNSILLGVQAALEQNG